MPDTVTYWARGGCLWRLVSSCIVRWCLFVLLLLHALRVLTWLKLPLGHGAWIFFLPILGIIYTCGVVYTIYLTLQSYYCSPKLSILGIVYMCM